MTIIDKLLTINRYSRPGTKRTRTTKIAVHYVANPKSTAIANRNYFENCRITEKYVSSHYIIGLDGEIIRCVPEDEIAYCTNAANAYSISIECCHPDWTGKLNDKTYAALVELCTDLLRRYQLAADDLIRHFDVTGKVCPKNFVPASRGGTDTDDAANWQRFRTDVASALAGAQKPVEAPETAEGSFLVKITCASLNVRAGAGTGYKINTVVHHGEVYTIVETALVGRSAMWGRLKSGAGWINIGSKYCKRV